MNNLKSIYIIYNFKRRSYKCSFFILYKLVKKTLFALIINSEYKKIFDKIQKLEKQKEEMCKKINLRIEKIEKQKDVLVKKILIG